MIITDYADFCKIVRETLALEMPKAASCKKDAVFEIGSPLKGHHLRVDGNGWWRKLEGVNCCGQYRLASPLSNFQAATLTLG